MLLMILEAAFRSLLMAAVVLVAMRVLGVRAVLAQKVAWVLVLMSAALMPIAMRASWLSLERVGIGAVRIPVRRPVDIASVPEKTPSHVAGSAGALARFHEESIPSLIRLRERQHISKPSAAHRRDSLADSAEDVSFLAPPIETVPTVSHDAAVTTSAPVQNWKKRLVANWDRIKWFVLVAYGVVACVLLLRCLAGLVVAYRIHREASLVDSLEADTMGRVRVSRRVNTPVTIGSTVILPSDYAEWDEAKLRIVMAHELSHVRQRDFYLQLAAALHRAIFWFSPLGWWLQRKLSELGEALSDRAGLEQASSAASYARILLEFAAMPRRHSFFAEFAGVSMARSSNLSSRIERVLNGRSFRLAFSGGRRHAVLTAVLVPAALVAVVACIRIVPVVGAAQSPAPAASQAPQQGQSDAKIAGQVTGTDPDTNGLTDGARGDLKGNTPEEIKSVEVGSPDARVLTQEPQAPLAPPAADAVPPLAPPAPEAQVPMPPPAEAPMPPQPPKPGHGHSYSYSTGDGDSFAIVRGKDNTVTMSGDHGEELEKARQKYHNNFIWFEHDGKSYVVTDPAILAQSEALFKEDPAWALRQADLNRMQAKLDEEMARLQPEIEKASKPGPEFEAQMKKLQAQLAQLQSEDFKKLTEKISKDVSEHKMMTDAEIKELTNVKLAELQSRIGEIEGQIGEIQGKIGEREGLMGEKQGEIGERMGKLGEETGRLGELQGKHAEEASRKLKSLLDQAVKDGKAKPVQ
jgi:beta-lactamase regulating signal transducer with metallopeptidase domain